MLGLKFPWQAEKRSGLSSSRKLHLLLIGPIHTKDNTHTAGGIETGIQDLLQHMNGPKYSEDLKLTFLSNWNGRGVTNRRYLDRVKILTVLRMYVLFIWILLRYIFAKERVQSVQIHTSRGSGFIKDSMMVPLARLFGSRVVLSIHGYAMEDYLANLKGLFRAYTKLIFYFSDGLRTLADSVGVALSDELGVAPKKIHYIANGVETDRFVKASDGRSAEFTILFVGGAGTVKRKGALDLLVAFGQLRERGLQAKVTLVGSDSEAGATETLRTYCAENRLGDDVHIITSVPHLEMPAVYQTGTVFCLPSYQEGFPHSVLEAMSAGLPVVSTNVSGIPHLVEEGVGGFLCEPGDINALAGHLETLYLDPSLVQRMGAHNREVAVGKFAVTAQIDAMLRLHRSLIGAEEAT